MMMWNNVTCKARCDVMKLGQERCELLLVSLGLQYSWGMWDSSNGEHGRLVLCGEFKLTLILKML